NIRTAMDISDGLADDLSKLCLASNVSAKIFLNEVPVHSLLKKSFPETYIELALYGGEDYELLFTGNSASVNTAIQQLPEGACIIGEITDNTPGEISLVEENGSERVSIRQGWDHFA
ncbi:MAG: thiamine-phosphate kinase, partial [SAR202 cluster bacterium]